MLNYLQLARYVLQHGVVRPDRTGTGTLSVFGTSLRFNLQEGFPIVTTKRVPYDKVLHELIWMISGSDNIRYLVENKVRIWDEWPMKKWLHFNHGIDMSTLNEDEIKIWKKPFHEAVLVKQFLTGIGGTAGDVGPIYGVQWRSWDYDAVDQLGDVIYNLKHDPYSRRHLVTAWNPSQLHKMTLPPCHYSFQFYVTPGPGNTQDKLSCLVNMRSVDVFLGMPFDIACYATLTHMIAELLDMQVGELVMNFADTHIYLNHVDQIRTQLQRIPYPLPQIIINHHKRDIYSIDGFKFDDIELVGYESHPTIKGAVSV